MNNKENLEEGLTFTPNFNDLGLIPAIASCAQSGEVLMFAWMNEESLNKTIETGEAWYYSRSRAELWHKGATSGDIQKVIEIRTDCDQDCIWLKVEVQSDPPKACHTGRKTCFYRQVTKDGLKFIDQQ